MKTSSELSKTAIVLSEQKFPVKVGGNGPVACLAIGLGSLMQNTLSHRFKERFTVYSCDLYWHQNDKFVKPETLTIKQICEDIRSVAHQLGLENYVLLGHSCYGIVALEAAKNAPGVLGVVMVASPPAYNDEIKKYAQAYFEKHADDKRKKNDQERRNHYEKIKQAHESELSINAYIRDTARYWADYEMTDEEIKHIWRGVEAEDVAAIHFFSNLLPQHSLDKDLENITCPVLLAAGPFDFDCVPLELWKNHRITELLGEKFTIIHCPHSGHWPNIEDEDIFDQSIIEWSQNILPFKL